MDPSIENLLTPITLSDTLEEGACLSHSLNEACDWVLGPVQKVHTRMEGSSHLWKLLRS
ncbi:hypothetical protein OAK97_00395 [bacterium]|nr:hypothetical protein [bacterium]